ncbi:PSD1 and planctomycete cytochrome C domain-containing protein [Tautonia plasticadhaerens]|uniref:Planctomycete cytochrome C n=1 Tax=Tautonia plasticadhaerens TaxID=2527974 RepID=A0A518H1D9_9BACT|nr:PSD1 and planctomycete cytochrome C domain-containing protein [Tautonia plasticadhaerens]QDV34657.1 Planctomycete cytochrome C [Tautonia plasticadhaerens]
MHHSAFLIAVLAAPALGLGAGLVPMPVADATDRQAIEFFEARVRPVLVERCLGCHGPEDQKADLRLDSASAIRRGGDSGPVVEPGDPEASPLVWAIRYDDVVQMPPDGKLDDSVVADLVEWVRLGAPWPEASGPADEAKAAPPPEDSGDHWAFQPPRMPAIPEVDDTAWPATPIDRFVLAGLEARGLHPNPEADRRALIRRATFDLLGLPPTPEEVDAFADDPRPDAFERLVDRLLASPRYGERWGRHWLDVARYADTKGYVYTDREEPRFPFSYTYRDYVIDTFNADLPYDRFLREQVAADCLPGDGGDRTSLAALGFLTLGRRFLGNAHDIIDDRLDVLFRGTQALTVACARCHDHKYDPIPTADYYSLYGVLAATTERTVRLADDRGDSEATLAYEEGLRERKEAFSRAMDEARHALSDRLRSQVAEYLEAVPDAQRYPSEEHYVILAEGELNPLIVHRWRAYLLRIRDETQFRPIFGPWHAFEALSPARFPDEAPDLARFFAAGGDPEHPINPQVARLFDGPPPASMAEVARRYGAMFAGVDSEWRDALARADCSGAGAPSGLADPGREAIRRILYADDTPTAVPPVHYNQLEFYFDEKTRVELGKLQMEIDRWHLSAESPAPHALVLEDTADRPNPRIFLRGNPKTRGDEVPRRFLRVISGEDRRPFSTGSGRLELADCIASPANPLTARVMVNRIWMHHFGEGLVRTPSDFGTRGEPPTHPELLDHLALAFVEDGWSIKAMHRRILRSRTYRQSSADNPEARAVDPENRLLWRANRRRIEWEPMRDALLAAAGRLDPKVGGRPVSLTTAPFTPRRSVYGFVDRQDLPGVFRSFNLASPDQHTPQRHETTIPQQALFLMNSPFVVEQARALAARPEVCGIGRPDDRIRALYRLALQRAPSRTELEAGLRFLARPGPDPTAIEIVPRSAWQYGSAHLDEAAGRLSGFEPMGHWAGDAWQPGPDADRPMLTREGGFPGPDARRAAVRRWVAPEAGVVSVSGTIRHESGDGPGVIAAVVSSRSGVLGRWEVGGGEAEVEAEVDRVEVGPGDAIDFVVAWREGPGTAPFSWAPRIRPAEETAAGATWDAAEGFEGPAPEPLSAWEHYAQVLLLSNEFVFID